MDLDQLFQPFLERLLITSRLLVEDYQVDRQPMHLPERAGLEELTDQGDLPRLADGDQDNGQIARDAVRPQAGLALAIVFQAPGGSAQQAIGEQQVTGQLLKTACFVGLNVQHLQLLLGRVPGEIHGSFGGMELAVLVHQKEDILAACPGREHHADLEALPGFQGNVLPQAENRIKDEPLAVAKILYCPHGPGQIPTAADKPSPVGLELPLLLGRHVRSGGPAGKAVGDIERRIVFASWSSVGEEHLVFGNRLGLDEQFVEGRMLAIDAVGGHGQLNVAGKVDLAAAVGVVYQGNTAYFHVVFRRDADLCFGVDVVSTAPEDGPVQSEVHRIAFSRATDRMIGGGPQAIRPRLVEIAENSPAIAGLVRPPAADFPAFPAAIAAAAVGDHQIVATVGQQQGHGRDCMGGGIGACRRCDEIPAQEHRLTVPGRDQVQRRQGRDALLQQGLKGPDSRVTVEAAAERGVVQEVG